VEIDTGRLKIIPFSEEIIQAAMERDRERLTALGIVADEEWPEPDLVEALPHFQRLIRDHGDTGFNGWLMLEKRSREIVGSLGFMGETDENGSVEIGFGIVPGKRRQGYCEEAARALMGWAEGRPGVRWITARCGEDNEKSIGLLRKLGFSEIGREDALIEWKRGNPQGCAKAFQQEYGVS
jgi:RimJ/RimL family protein N-acetyltransferase